MRLQRVAEGRDRALMRDLAVDMGRSSIAAVLLVPSLLLISPLSGLPGMSAAGGLIIAMIAVQVVLGRHDVWLPGFVERLSLPSGKLLVALGLLDGPAKRFDRLPARWGERRSAPAPRRVGPGGICMVLGLVMPFLEPVPFSSTLLATVVALRGLSMMLKAPVSR